MANAREQIMKLGYDMPKALATSNMNAQQLGQFCFFGINKIEAALAAALYDEGVEPEKRVRVKEKMNVKLQEIAQEMIVEALNSKFLNEARLRKARKKGTRMIITEKEEE